MANPQPLDLRLIVKRHGLILDERAIGRAALSVGRDPECDIVLDDPASARRIAEFQLREDGLWVVDSGSMDGVRVGGEVVDRQRLRPGDEVEIGSFTLEVVGNVESSNAAEPTVVLGLAGEDDPTVVLPQRWAVPLLVLPDGSRLRLEPGTTTLGRSADCDILLDSTAASKRHAELRVEGDVVTVVDLESTNGTRVNDQQVQECALADGDTLELADIVLGLEIPSAGTSFDRTLEPVDNAEDVVAETDVRRQIRQQAGARGGENMDVEAPSKRRRLLLGALAVFAALAVGLAIVSLMAPEPPPPPPLELPTVDATRLLREGLELYEAGEVLDAIDAWEQAMLADSANPEIRDRYAQTLYRVGLIYEGDGQVQNAVAAWRRLVSGIQDPEHPYAVRAAAKLRKYESAR